MTIGLANTFSNDRFSYGNLDSFFIGLCVAGALLNIWSIFLPANYLSLLFLIAVSIAYWAFNPGKLKMTLNPIKSASFFKLKYLLPFSILLLFVTLYALLPPLFYDTYLYHIPALKWYEQYKAVPGLANFHSRFGFNSTSLLLSTTFSFNFIFNQPIFALNSLCILIFTTWLMKNTIDKKTALSLISLIILILFFKFYSKNISSLSTDILPNILIVYVLLRLAFSNFQLNDKNLILWVIPLFCITLKLSTLAICLLCILPLYSSIKTSSYRYLTFLIITSLIVIIPWMTRNVILTGYIGYPMPSIDLFNFDWEIPMSNVINEKNWIYSWARIPGLHWEKVLSMPFPEWFSIWWKAKKTVLKILFVLNYLSPVLLIFLLIKNKQTSLENYPVRIPILVLYSSRLSLRLWIHSIISNFSFTYFQ